MIAKRTGPFPRHWSSWVIPEPNSGCWLWDGDVAHQDGRAVLDRRINGRRRRLTVARVVWEEVKGPVPADRWVLHTCDAPGCVNPDHLYLGTHADNMRDVRVRNRSPRPSQRQSHCKRGHSLDDAYVYPNARGYPIRHCRTCVDLRQKGLLK